MSTATVERLPRTRYGNPVLRRTDDVLEYWIERVALVAPGRESFEKGSMICASDSIYHYGRHFELARILRDKRGRARLVLLNGDSYGGSGGFGPSTSSRQGDVRRAVQHTNVPGMVVPFSALEGAGIDFNTIMPIQVRDGRITIEQHSSRERPAKLAQMPSGETKTETYMGWGYKQAGGEWTDRPCHFNDKHEWGERTREVPIYVDDPNRTTSFRSGHGFCENGAQLDEDGIWRWSVRRHWLGDSIFRARSTERRTRKATREELGMNEWHRAWQATTNRLDNAESNARRRSWALAKAGREASERGDYRRMTRALFAASGVADEADRRGELLIRHRSIRLPTNRVQGARVPITVTRWATFLSSFDYQESIALYFLCELPYGAKPNTVDEAVEALKPPEVVAALARGLNVVRQGDLFAIPTKLTKRQIRRLRGRQDFTKRLRVLGTNHSVTEGIVLKGGAVLGRGIMRHEPEGWRPPDHAQQKLGDAWHLLVRNTVPRTH